MTHEQHVVPQVYLKRFAEGKKCYVINEYGKIAGKSIEGICYEEDFYELKTAEGDIIKQNNIEKNLLGKLETIYSPFFDELFESLDYGKIIRFLKVDDNGQCLITWMILMLLRNPLVFSTTPEVAREFGFEWNDLQCHNNSILNISLLTEKVSKEKKKTHKIVFFKNNTNVSFLTGNYPCIVKKDNAGYKRIFMPISPKYYVLLIDKRDKNMKEYSILSANDMVVDYCNKLIISNTVHIKTEVTHKYIISKDKETLEYYHEYIKKQLSKETQ